MTCSVPGCYAKAHRRMLCRNHYALWLQATAPAERERGLRANPVPNPGVCVCSEPIVMAVGMFPGAFMCQRCGRPPAESLSPRREAS